MIEFGAGFKQKGNILHKVNRDDSPTDKKNEHYWGMWDGNKLFRVIDAKSH